MNNFNHLNMFQATISPIVRITRLCLQRAGSIVDALYRKL